MTENKGSQSVVAAAGIIGAFAFCVLWMIAVFADPSWTFGENTISDLGISESETAKVAITIGCIITGAVMALFGIGKVWNGKSAIAAAGVFICMAGIFLALVGVFNKDVGDIHKFIAYLFFICATLGIVIGAIGDYKIGNSLFAATAGGLVVIAFASYFILSCAGWEVISVICILAWFVIDCIKVGLGKC